MANDVTGNPWILDTVTDAVIWNGNVFVDHFEMVDYPANTDVVAITDGAGRVVWEGNGWVDLSPVVSGKIGVVYNGLRLSASSSAATRVRVYLSTK